MRVSAAVADAAAEGARGGLDGCEFPMAVGHAKGFRELTGYSQDLTVGTVSIWYLSSLALPHLNGAC